MVTLSVAPGDRRVSGGNVIDRNTQKLFRREYISPTAEPDRRVEVRRGMVVETQEGRDAGRVAALVVDTRTHEVSQIVVSRAYATPEYRMVPVEKVVRVTDGRVYLQLHAHELDELPVHTPFE